MSYKLYHDARRSEAQRTHAYVRDLGKAGDLTVVFACPPGATDYINISQPQLICRSCKSGIN